MKCLSVALSCLLLTSGFADTLQHVEYHLPSAAKTWFIGNQFESEEGTTIIYLPDGVKRQETDEFFGVNANKKIIDINDPSPLKAYFLSMLPSLDIDFHVIEKDDASILYEWSAQEDNIKKFYSFGRAFSSPEGTVLLAYQTKDLSLISQARSIWLQALKEAKQTL